MGDDIYIGLLNEIQEELLSLGEKFTKIAFLSDDGINSLTQKIAPRQQNIIYNFLETISKKIKDNSLICKTFPKQLSFDQFIQIAEVNKIIATGIVHFDFLETLSNLKQLVHILKIDQNIGTKILKKNQNIQALVDLIKPEEPNYYLFAEYFRHKKIENGEVGYFGLQQKQYYHPKLLCYIGSFFFDDSIFADRINRWFTEEEKINLSMPFFTQLGEYIIDVYNNLGKPVRIPDMILETLTVITERDYLKTYEAKQNFQCKSANMFSLFPTDHNALINSDVYKNINDFVSLPFKKFAENIDRINEKLNLNKYKYVDLSNLSKLHKIFADLNEINESFYLLFPNESLFELSPMRPNTKKLNA